MGRIAAGAVVVCAAAACADLPQTDRPAARACRPACPASTEAGAAALEALDDRLTRYRQDHEIPGMAVGVVCGPALVWARGYGVWALDDPRPVTPETPFRIASLTKLFTATAIMTLAEAGALSLDDPVSRHLPWFEVRRPPAIEDAPITIRHLLTHTAGLPRDSRLTDFSRLHQPARADAIRALADERL